MHKDDIYYNNRFSAILYPYGKCNLNCSYCFIDKNSDLTIIDKKLEESFKNEDYYLNFIEEFLDPELLSVLQLWGGEPTLGFFRLENLLPKLIEKYNKLNTITFSSNFATNSFVEDIFIILNILSKYYDRNFIMNLQMSYDGPDNLTDICRGINTSKKIKDNYKKLISKFVENKNKYQNIKILIHNKPTLNALTMRMLGDNDNNILNYWKDQKEIKEEIENIKISNLSYESSLLTIADPSPWTQEDGIYFFDFCKRSRKLEEENKKLSQYTNSFVPYNFNIKKYKNITSDNLLFWKNLPYTHCGACKVQYGFLPENLISICHSSFVDMIESYKKIDIKKIENEHTILSNFFNVTNNPLIFNKKDYKKINFLLSGILENIENIIGFNATIIQQLAKSKQIEQKYSSENMAYVASGALNFIYPICYRNNFNITNSLITYSLGEFKLFLNGALEIILNEKF